LLHPAGERRAGIVEVRDLESRQAPDPVSPPGPGLGELLTLVGRGDQVAFETVYDRVAPAVFGLIRRVLPDTAQAEEVAQEALLEVWRSAGRFDPARGSAMAWIMTIAHGRAVDRVRSERAAAEREARAASTSAPPPGDEVAEAVEASLEAERVRHCLDGLTGTQRESITLAYYSGLSYPQVASALGVALGTVKTRIRDGLKRLRDCLGVAW
jgi:RNA polymerase sigma-70 factor (ECF subfamily)